MFRTVPPRFSVAALLFVVALAPLDEGVDFSRPPDQGMRIKVTEQIKGRLTGTLEIGGNEVAIGSPLDATEIYVHTVLEVKERKVLKIQREYEESGGEDDATPLAWKTLRATWEEDGDGEGSITVKEDEEWKPAGELLTRFVTLRSLRQPILLLPPRKMEAGQSWEFGAKEIRRYFPAVKLGNAAAKLGGEGKITFREVARIKDEKCAVLDVEIQIDSSIEGTEVSTTRLAGVVHYSLEHRVIVGLKGKGTMKRYGPAAMSGSLQLEYKVKVLEKEDG